MVFEEEVGSTSKRLPTKSGRLLLKDPVNGLFEDLLCWRKVKRRNATVEDHRLLRGDGEKSESLSQRTNRRSRCAHPVLVRGACAQENLQRNRSVRGFRPQ